MNIAMVGFGAWGTALGRHLQLGGHRIKVWDHDRPNLGVIKATGRNEKYLAGIDLLAGIEFEPDLKHVSRDVELIVLAVPSKAFREIARSLSGFRGVLVSVTKGIEYDSGRTMSGILGETVPHASVVALSGPTLALEVARGMPTAAVVASRDERVAHQVQGLFHLPTFRVYTCPDVLGVELGGALKNVIAIAAGVCDGMGFGANSKAALVTRAIVEIRRLGVACGAHSETFSGLSGLGDLVVTCFSPLSRNRTLGERLGRGEKLDEILATTVSVAEGYPTSRSACRTARNLGVDSPIMDQIHAMLYEGKDLARALGDLLGRDSKHE